MSWARSLRRIAERTRECNVRRVGFCGEAYGDGEGSRRRGATLRFTLLVNLFSLPAAPLLAQGALHVEATSSSVFSAIYAKSDSFAVIGVQDSGASYGYLNAAVAGSAATGIGVYGQSDSGAGVLGESQNHHAVYGNSSYSYGVHGESYTSDGVFGEASADNKSGVYAMNTNSNGYAAYFGGRVHVNGQFSKAGGSFKIDHPLDPENRYLFHSFVESPDMMNVYNGNITLDQNGEAWVELPEWFEALNRDFRYQLTCLGGFAPVYVAERIINNRFMVAGGYSGLEVSWQVTGIRQDPWAEAHRISVEELKSDEERGAYLHPVEWGQPMSKDVEWVHHPDVMTRKYGGHMAPNRIDLPSH